MSLGTHPSSAFSWVGGSSWRSVGEDQVPPQIARVWSCKPFGEGRRGLEKGSIFSSDQVTPHKLEIQVRASTQTNCLSLSCTDRSVRFRTVEHFGTQSDWILTQFQSNALWNYSEDLSKGNGSGGLALPPHLWHSKEHSGLYYHWDLDRKIVVTLITALKKQIWHSYIVFSHSALFFVLV